MGPPLAAPRQHWVLRCLIAFIGIHSLLLGIIMLTAPGVMLRLFGFPDGGSLFFPSQSGVFLSLLSVCYLLALKEPAFVKIIVISKAVAVAFLVVHAAFFAAPPIIWLAALGDGAMLAAMVIALRYNRRVVSSKAV